ncbi:hypothetical protein WDY80_23880 (plasmid) [Gordonia hongkongensis]|uniref:hypothetical protein n=1 Tax=Gordonia hongkongensis TaxID=1701090 RepID=UPI0030D19EDC
MAGTSRGPAPWPPHTWSKYAWKTIDQAMRSTTTTVRFVAILAAIFVLPTVAAAISFVIVRSVYF